ncbi:hypothetical protein SynA1562_00322 [Synechococcus sp. A15-62]|nr:hypothetical protein SynA1562_00322 [Synechococcus sp. A15-62]
MKKDINENEYKRKSQTLLEIIHSCKREKASQENIIRRT